MPELPDVEVFRKTARKALRKRIEGVRVHKPGIVMVSESTMKRQLVGRKFISTQRKGKYLFMRTEDDTVLLLHFGMTGHLTWEGRQYSAMDISFWGGSMLSVVSRRKLGMIDLVYDSSKRLEDLGKDALSISSKDLFTMIRTSRRNIKSLLMDQEEVAGLGNIYADEILYHSRIRPDRKANTLTKAQVMKLHEKMHEVLRKAISYDADPARMPKGYLIPKRQAGARVNGCIVEKTKINGRPTYFCPSVQR